MPSHSSLTPLLPNRHPTKDLFICDVGDAVFKDLIQHMEHPFYALSKKSDTRIRRYESGGNWIEIIPSVKGLATIYDKDILIYCISQIMSKLKNGEKLQTPRVKINTYELLRFANRGTAGKDYDALSAAIDRLAGTRIRTNIQTGGEEQYENFGLIDAASIRRKNGLNGRLLSCEIKLSDWVFKAIQNNEVLTLHPDYFRLRRPLERRIYELARKHCGHQVKWQISTKNLLNKSGSQSSLAQFKYMISGLVKTNHLPDYTVAICNNNIVFTNRNTKKAQADLEEGRGAPVLKDRTFKVARSVAPRYDIHGLYREWSGYWVSSGKPILKNPDAAFIGFCKKKFKQNPIY